MRLAAVREASEEAGYAQRGRVYAARLSHLDEDMYFLVVSNNRRNRNLPQVLAAALDLPA